MYKVYHYGSASEFYFHFRPTKKDIKKVLIREMIDIEEDILDVEVSKLIIQKQSKTKSKSNK